MENIITLDNRKIELAIRAYYKNIERVKKYNKDHPDLCKLQSKKTYDKTKNEHPEKYKAMLARKAEIYQIKKLSQIKIL